MAYFKCTGGINPTGDAGTGDVKSGKTFSNANGIDLVGTFAAQEKTVTSSRSAQTVTPDSGKYLSKVTVNALTPTGTYTPTSRAANIDMGATSNYRYVTTTSVPNSNSGTYTYAANSTGGTADMGAANTYRYVNAANVYAKGKADGSSFVSGNLYISTSLSESNTASKITCKSWSGGIATFNVPVGTYLFVLAGMDDSFSLKSFNGTKVYDSGTKSAGSTRSITMVLTSSTNSTLEIWLGNGFHTHVSYRFY